MDHDQLKDLLSLEVLGRLEGEEARAVAAHLAEGCDECQAELRAFREALAAMAISMAGEGPTDRIWQRLENRFAAGETAALLSVGLDQDRSPKRATGRAARPEVSRVWRIGAVAASAAAITLAVMMRNYVSESAATRQQDFARIAMLEQQARSLVSELEDRNRELATLHDQVAITGQLTQAVLAPDARMIRLAPLTPAPNAAGLVAVTPSRNHAVLQVAGLPTPPPGKEYELWWIGSKSGPVKAALFAPGTNGEATVASTLPPIGEQLLASAITLEPAGGVDKPTGAMYLKGAP
jgi:anti-sigma-K factor RskA